MGCWFGVTRHWTAPIFCTSDKRPVAHRQIKAPALPAPSVFAISSVLLFWVCFLCQGSNAQNATLHPSEVRALNTIFEQWGAEAAPGLWNISGEPCSGAAINGTDWEDRMNNPSIQCDCTFDSGTTCHITRLRVYAMEKNGVIPEELASLSYLQFLKIDQNFFSGPLPAFIGNLSALQLLSVAINLFSGPIPSEIGNLKELTQLSLGHNNFSGTLPPELGNLVKLEQLYINSCGASGEIPLTFAKLLNMQTMLASDSPFTGKIPSFIGNWTRLTSLRFQGNYFEGPIPSSFSNLTSLTSLRISDLYNVSSSIDFVKDLKNLTDLVLRNALVSGNIPPYIGELTSLQTLDLGFNNLTGQVPSTLFNLNSLTSLFLGNNSLSGTLPPQKSDKLQIIDLSYNYLSGSFPSWVTPNLRLNLVANQFTFDSSNVSVLPGLNCLQKSFPCNPNKPLYANFSINCGGQEIRSADGMLYETENSTEFGPSSYYVVDTEKWAVSNVGMFADTSDPSYTWTTLTQVVGTTTPELFQTSRLSPGSLRYYGLGLQNGIYNVSLLFAETVFSDRSTRKWESLGKRVFNIYIQGNLKLKDFDISKEAGVGRAIPKEFTANVSQNFLEIHLFWAGKGTCCIPKQGNYGPLISALRVVSDFPPSVSGVPPTSGSKNRTGLIVGIVVPVVIVSLVLFIVVVYSRRKQLHVEAEEDLLGIGPRPNTYTYAELRTATDDFNPTKKLGEGGFGPVYKGKLNDGNVVAVKLLSVTSHQGKSQFITEIATISAVQHRNLVKLYGCCIEGNKRILVYEYLENRSLDQALFGETNNHLDWPTRFIICLGTARGLAYLHEESRPRIVHRDVKASNILLDVELCPKISDFGLAKLYDDKKTHISTRVAGTIGYLAPEYAMRGLLTEKADVFGFGVVLLEILSGRPNSDDSLITEKKYLLEWAWNLHESGRSLELMDPKLEAFDESEAMRVLGVALLCIQASPMMRPPMSRVVAMLSGDIDVSTTAAAKPSYLTDWDFKDITSGFLDYDATTSSQYSKGSSSQQHSMQADDPTPASTLVYAPSPPNVAEPMLRGSIAEGR